MPVSGAEARTALALLTTSTATATAARTAAITLFGQCYVKREGKWLMIAAKGTAGATVGTEVNAYFGGLGNADVTSTIETVVSTQYGAILDFAVAAEVHLTTISGEDP